jgi:exonuclease SbcC
MKPHRLIIEGLRSYRGRTEIDFTDASLFAIVGDTGSGKSSILEAMVYALYASATWTRQPGELISDGMRTMTVELTFEVDGRMWLVRRSMSRTNYPPSIHLLTAVDDSSIRFDTATAVDREIERLLGLNVDAFCSAVLLPQGKFEKLLTATAADRTRILKGIFRLERLDEARALAKALAERYEPAYQDLRRERARLHDDPVAVADEARTRLVAADAAIAKLTDLRRRWVDLDERQRSSELSRAALVAEQTALQTALAAVDEGEATRLAAVLEELETALAPLLAAQAAAETAEADAAAAVDAAHDTGLDSASLGAYRVTITQARTALPLVAGRRTGAEAEASAIAVDEEAWAVETAGLGSLEEQASAASAAAEAARRAVEAAGRELDTTSRALDRARGLAAQVATTVSTLGDKSDAVEAASIFMKQAETDRQLADDRLETSEQTLAAARSRDAAAVASHGHHPGDPCPVCARVLPNDWRAPDAPLLDGAIAEREAATIAAKAAGRALTAAEQTLVLAEQQVEATKLRLEELHAQQAAAAADVMASLPTWTFDTDRPDVLAGLEESLAAAAATGEAAGKLADEARLAATTSATRLAERRTAFDRRRSAMEQALRMVESEETRISGALAGLPSSLELVADASEETFEAVLGRLDDLDRAEGDRHSRLRDARAAQRRTAEGIREIENRRKLDYDAPMAAYQGHLARLSSAVERAAAGLAARPKSLRKRGDDEVARAADLLQRLATQKAALESEIAATQISRHELLAAAALERAAEIEDGLSVNTGERAVALAELQQAEGQIPLAVELDDRLNRGGALLETLNELARLLADGQFVGYVVNAKQRALLGIASTILDEMSGGRYGFSEDFQIVDRTSGQPRSPRTLSGGETFQASLALALGLVELAGRSGGRLSSLFLDEGFGTLDANALDDALEELERRAAAGRVIGVISHLRSVADRIEHVLRVDKDLGRTHVRWVGGADLDRLTSEDLAHTSGLLV